MTNKISKYTDEFYLPETLLSSWVNLSFIGLTTAMVFYKVSLSESIKADKRIAVLITVVLLLVCILYLFVSVRNYNIRISGVIKRCSKDPNCFSNHEKHMRNTQRDNSFLSVIVILIQLLIIYLVVRTI